jgi:hypothetical protein
MAMASMVGKDKVLFFQLAGKGNGRKFLAHAGMNGAVQFTLGKQFQKFLLYLPDAEGIL